MGRTFFLFASLCFINILIIDCYNINYRISFNSNYGLRRKSLNKKTDAFIPSNSDTCIPVQAVKELGCIIPNSNSSFQGVFEPICERHQLCYACGFARSISERQCNKMAFVNMYDICSQNKSISSSSCMKKTFARLAILRQFKYRSFSSNPGLSIECYQDCVVQYLQKIKNS